MTQREKFIKIIEFMEQFPEELHANGQVINRCGGRTYRSIEGMLPLIFPETFYLREMSIFGLHYPIFHSSDPEKMEVWDQDVNQFLGISQGVSIILFNTEDSLQIAIQEAYILGVEEEELKFTYHMEGTELGSHATLEELIDLWTMFIQLNLD